MKKFLDKKSTLLFTQSNEVKQGNIALKYLVMAVASLMVVPSTTEADTGAKQIGDLEIYKPAEGGKVTIMMMLDTSGSMSEPYMRSQNGSNYDNRATACNLDSGTAYTPLAGIDSMPNDPNNPLNYKRYGCQTGKTGKEKRYFVKEVKTIPVTETTTIYTSTANPYPYNYASSFTSTKREGVGSSTWNICDTTNGNTNKSTCTVSSSAVSTTDYTSESDSAVTSGSKTVSDKTVPSTTSPTLVGDDGRSYKLYKPSVRTIVKTYTTTQEIYYSKIVDIVVKPEDIHYDRLTQLKDAIFQLMDNKTLDSNTVQIGIGQFSTQSDSANVAKSATGTGGKVLVPVGLLTDAQRTLIKQEVAKLIGSASTPTAHAYAEAAAYMFGTTTVAMVNSTRSTTYYGYSGFNDSVTTSKNATNYKSPIEKVSQCDGLGVYFLTDGAPNNSLAPATVMKAALGLSTDFSVPTTGNNLPEGSGSANAMPYVGEFAKRLRTSTTNEANKLNPKNASIRTAVVGFGSEFKVNDTIIKSLDTPETDKLTGLPKTDKDGNVIYKKDDTGAYIKSNFYDCSQITGTDAKNACNWGAKTHPSLPGVGGFGEGGFFSAQSSDDVVNSIKTFVDDLNQTLPSTPSGTIVVPDDPYRVDSQMAVAYYPTLQAEVGTDPAIWSGNMKKFNLDNGTLYGNSKTRLFKDSSGALNPDSEDLWSSKNEPSKNNAVTAGGLYSNLVTPKDATNNVRKVYIEDMDAADHSKPKLRLLGVDASGKLTLDGQALSDTNTFIDTTTYTKERVQTLLQFMGFTLTDAQKAVEVKDMGSLVLDKPTTEFKVLGATVHSTPSSVSYSATLDSDGKVTDTRDDYVLFGSSDGALHMVNADNYTAGGNGGKEKFAFIPKAMLLNQPEALVAGKSSKGMGKPYFGIDAPWLVNATYNYDTANSKVTVTPCSYTNTGTDASPSPHRECENAGIYAYGGLRMGGEALYGMNLTNKDAPSLMFSITPTTSGFERMGQIWSKPTKAKIKTSTTDTKGTDVLVFGGGYDTCYENPNFQLGVAATTGTNGNNIDAACAAKTETKGNAVYIVNAKTGELIWSASSTAGGTKNKTVTDMKNSIVGGITVLDRNNDGFLDHLYFADLGGQVFRADFTSPTATSNSFANKRVVKVLTNKYATDNKQFAFRFYERPVVSFYRNDNGNLFAMVNVISGDRSSPLSKTREDNANADRLYGIIDNDITKADALFYADSFTSTAQNITDSDLVALGGSTLNATQKAALIAPLKAGTKKGWYYPLTRFDGYGNVKYNKGVGKSEVIDSFLYTTVYNPDISYSKTDDCAAKVTGGSERELYCLPYGVCMDDASTNGTGGFVPAGQGIQELIIGPASSSKKNQRLLIGTLSLTERSSNNDTLKNTRVDFGSDSVKQDRIGQTGISKDLGDGSAPEYIFNERYTMTPSTWFEGNR